MVLRVTLDRIGTGYKLGLVTPLGEGGVLGNFIQIGKVLSDNLAYLIRLYQ